MKFQKLGKRSMALIIIIVLVGIVTVFYLFARSTPEKTVNSFLEAVITEDYKVATDNLTAYGAGKFTKENLTFMNSPKVKSWKITDTSNYGQSRFLPGEEFGTTEYYSKVETDVICENGDLRTFVFTLVEENGWKIFDIKIGENHVLDG